MRFHRTRRFLRDIFTGKDGQTYDIARVIGMMMAVGFLVNTGYAIHKGQPWDASSWGIGAAAVLAGIGAFIGLKANTEPGMPPAPVPTAPPDAEVK